MMARNGSGDVNGHEKMHEYGHMNCMKMATKNAYGIIA
jgi:hypothetical protein